MFLFRKKKKRSASFDERVNAIINSKVPTHVAIIMDGNGRWAKEHLLPRIAGHKEGMENVRLISLFANKLGIKVLTMYAFSTENWRRSKDEVSYLMKLPEEFLNRFLPELMENNMRVTSIGESGQVPDSTLLAIQKAAEATKGNTGLILNFAFNYGSRAEMIIGINQLIADVQEGLQSNNISEEIFNQYLMTKDLPDPDLMIRTSGELRLSNFMLWQLAYTEFYFTDIYWPDFTEESFLETIESYLERSRRYGGREGEGVENT